MRLRRGWSQEELAAKTGLSMEVIAAYESEPTVLTTKTALQVFDGMPAEAQDRPARAASALADSPPAWLLAEMEARLEEMAAALEIDKGNLGEAIKVFCWSVRGQRLDAERTRALAREERRGARLRRPYALPVRER